MQGAALVLRNRSSSSFAGGSSAVFSAKENKHNMKQVYFNSQTNTEIPSLHALPFFSVFFSLLFPRSLRRLSLERDLRGPPSFSSPGFPNSLTLSRSHSRSARALSRRSISRSRSAHWSRSGSREGRPDVRPRPEPGPCSSAPGLSAVPKPLWKSSYKKDKRSCYRWLWMDGVS